MTQYFLAGVSASIDSKSSELVKAASLSVSSLARLIVLTLTKTVCYNHHTRNARSLWMRTRTGSLTIPTKSVTQRRSLCNTYTRPGTIFTMILDAISVDSCLLLILQRTLRPTRSDQLPSPIWESRTSASNMAALSHD